ncbi:hypothetical protein FJ960_01970 [Mesorhizobium sp. B2-3-11]|uniref:hypothetical protein n=1 Tax=Mesorhizobium sp. B2-3-11 TaxID=2589953 RepID=UPI0011281B5A|nr:hypothetical protein [Mesorhizobium sp. B2-3-11]TPM11533.1 hypothetical protein FJ960_01970 [Mesorhizobium sp. B2-3-11]
MTRPKDFPPLWFGASDVQQAAHKLIHLMLIAKRQVEIVQTSIALADAGFSEIGRYLSAIADAAPTERRPEAVAKERFEQAKDWTYIGAHSAIRSLYFFKETLEEMADFLAGSQLSSALINSSVPQKAIAQFDAAFPTIKTTRNA